MRGTFITIFVILMTAGTVQCQSYPTLGHFGVADTIQGELFLNDTMDLSKCSFWETGDYKIFVSTQRLAEFLQSEYSGLEKAMQTIPSSDSIQLLTYKRYADRFLNAHFQLTSGDEGVNLKDLVLYIGPENSERNMQPSQEIEQYIKTAIESGNASVFFKGKLQHKLQKKITADYVMSIIKLFAEEENNCVFIYYGYINW